MTKPVGHFSYLAGKWLGVLTVNLILLMIAGLSIFAFVQYLRTQPVATGLEGQIDLLQVNEQVLTARAGARPDYPQLTSEQVQTRVNQLIERDPELSLLETVPLAVRRNLANEVINEFNARQRSIPPAGAARTYAFSGLQSARKSSSPLSLRYRFFIMGNDEHSTFRCVFIFNEDMNNAIEREYVPTITHSLQIGSDLVQEDGTLSLTIVNPVVPPPDRPYAGALFFEYEDGLELLYRVSSFETNFVRAMSIMMVKLGLLSVLGIFCATFLSFPVACLFTFTVFLAGSIGPFLSIALDEYYPPAMRAESWKDPGLVIVWAFQSCIRQIARGLVFALRSFGEFKPTQLLVEGRAISMASVLASVFKLGILWSGVSLVAGFLILRSRQLAIYSGHG